MGASLLLSSTAPECFGFAKTVRLSHVSLAQGIRNFHPHVFHPANSPYVLSFLLCLAVPRHFPTLRTNLSSSPRGGCETSEQQAVVWCHAVPSVL